MKYPVFDGHNDVLMHIHYPELGTPREFFEDNPGGHIDLPRARRGGMAGGFFAVYIPTEPEYRKPIGVSDTVYTEEGYQTPLARQLDPEYARHEALGMIDTLFRLERESEGALKVVRTATEIAQCIETETLAAILHFEGADPIDPELETLPGYYEQGLRSLGIVWSRPNAFGHGVPFRFPHSTDTGPGLTRAGERLLHACNSMGILIDLAHINEKGFWDVARLSKAPLVSTHTASHAITPSTRNLTNKQLDAIRDTDGMVGLNFNVRDVRADGREEIDTTFDHYVKQLDYLVERVGLDRVGLGSDFDGALISSHIWDVEGLPKLIGAFQERGYDDAALRKITHENWLRVLRLTWGE